MATLGPPAWALRGDVCRAVVIAGVRVDVLADVVHEECVRRAREGPPAGALGWRQLGALSLLPHDVPIPWAEVDLATRVLIDGLPAGAVVTDGRTVRRCWRPTLELRAVSVVAATPSPALDDVSMFTAVAPCVLTLTAAPDDPVAVVARAVRRGVGVLVVGAARPDALTAPPSTAAVRDDARRWEIAELLYAAVRDGRGGHVAVSPVAG